MNRTTSPCHRTYPWLSVILVYVLINGVAEAVKLADLDIEPLSQARSTAPLTKEAAFLEHQSQTRQFSASYHELDSGRVGENKQRLPLWAGLPIYLLFCVFCICYGLHRQRASAMPKSGLPETSGPKRITEYDFAKFLLMFTVIWYHAHFMAGIKGVTYISQHWDRWFSVWRMSGFAFISGVFGASTSYESMTGMLCYTLGCTVMMTLLTDFFHVIEWHAYGGSLHLQILHVGCSGVMGPVHFWYIISLCVWRLTISPVFHVSKTHAGRWTSAMPLALVWVASYLCRHTISKAAIQSNWVGTMNHFTGFVGLDTTYYGMFYALGLVCKPTDWARLFGDRRCQILATGLILLWYVCLGTSANFRIGSVWACITADGSHHNFKGCYNEIVKRTIDDPIGWASLGFDLGTFAVVATLVLAVMSVFWLLASMVRAAAPGVYACCESWGSRTLYSYVVSQYVVQEILLSSAKKVFLSVPASVRGLAVFVFAMQLHVALCSSGSERLLSWIVMPYWIRDAVHWCGSKICSRAGSSRDLKAPSHSKEVDSMSPLKLTTS